MPVRPPVSRLCLLASLVCAGPAAAQVLAPNLVYTTVQPCRLFDTLRGGGRISPGGAHARAFNVVGGDGVDFTGQGGRAGGCAVPGYFTPPAGPAIPQAQALVINLVAVNPQGAGGLRVWASDQRRPAAPVLNYAPLPGLNIANTVVVALRQDGQGGDITIQADFTATDVRGDVVGYFSNNVQTNTAVGFDSLHASTPGTGNTAFGALALAANTGSGNTAVGGSSLAANTTGSANTAIGFNSLALLTTGNGNVALGGNSLQSNRTGNGNVAIGDLALGNNVSGSNNVAIGFSAGQNETGSNRLYVANSAGTPLIYGQFDTQRVGINTTNPQATLSVHGTAQIDSLGSGSVCADAAGRLASCSLSDARLKRDVVDLGQELDLFGTLAGLRAVAFNWDTTQQRASQLGARREIGLIAQEVERVLPQVVSTQPDGYKSVDYAKLSALLVEVVKAQKARLESQQTRLEAQQQMLEQLQRQVGELSELDAPRR